MKRRTDDIAAYSDAVQLQMPGRDAHLAHFQALQNLLYHIGLKVTALITMYLPQYSKAAEEAVTSTYTTTEAYLIGNGVRFWPLDKIVCFDQGVLVSLVAQWEGPAT